MHSTIMTVGTYSWWAAALASGTTTYQRKVAVKNSAIGKLYVNVMHEFYPDKWVPLD